MRTEKLTEEQRRLVEENVKLAPYIYHKLGKTRAVISLADDLISEGYIGLVKAAKSFDAGRGIKFVTFASRCITNEMLMFLRKESLLFKALKVRENREHYCRKADKTFMERLNAKKYGTTDAIKKLWYNGGDESGFHYSQSRYRALNLHSVWQKGTVEWRCFNSTLHAGEVKTYIQLCLAINNQALTQTSAAYRETTTTNDKFTFRTWLIRLGLNGEEYETARHHLLKNLTGDIAWRDNRRAA